MCLGAKRVVKAGLSFIEALTSGRPIAIGKFFLGTLYQGINQALNHLEQSKDPGTAANGPMWFLQMWLQLFLMPLFHVSPEDIEPLSHCITILGDPLSEINANNIRQPHEIIDWLFSYQPTPNQFFPYSLNTRLMHRLVGLPDNLSASAAQHATWNTFLTSQELICGFKLNDRYNAFTAEPYAAHCLSRQFGCAQGIPAPVPWVSASVQPSRQQVSTSVQLLRHPLKDTELHALVERSTIPPQPKSYLPFTFHSRSTKSFNIWWTNLIPLIFRKKPEYIDRFSQSSIQAATSQRKSKRKRNSPPTTSSTDHVNISPSPTTPPLATSILVLPTRAPESTTVIAESITLQSTVTTATDSPTVPSVSHIAQISLPINLSPPSTVTAYTPIRLRGPTIWSPRNPSTKNQDATDSTVPVPSSTKATPHIPDTQIAVPASTDIQAPPHFSLETPTGPPTEFPDVPALPISPQAGVTQLETLQPTTPASETSPTIITTASEIINVPSIGTPSCEMINDPSPSSASAPTIRMPLPNAIAGITEIFTHPLIPPNTQINLLVRLLARVGGAHEFTDNASFQSDLTMINHNITAVQWTYPFFLTKVEVSHRMVIEFENDFAEQQALDTRLTAIQDKLQTTRAQIHALREQEFSLTREMEDLQRQRGNSILPDDVDCCRFSLATRLTYGEGELQRIQTIWATTRDTWTRLHPQLLATLASSQNAPPSRHPGSPRPHNFQQA